ncbi:MAG: ABC transporter permease subunit [Synergistaceae bacterium]|jgi:NitT/TauT family transport system permease protein|nr:ABC transporter permease subunit [Synergistaceae bacterium]
MRHETGGDVRGKKGFSPWPPLAILAFAFALGGNILIPPVRAINETPYRTLVGFIALYMAGRYGLSFFRPGVKAAVEFKARFFAAVGIALLAWDMLSTKAGIFPLPFFPGPVQIVEVARADWRELLRSTLYSLRLFAYGFASGTVLGVVTGILIGWSRQWNYWLFPVLKVCGIVPAVAWIPFGMAVFPSSFITGVFMIAICSWFPVALATTNGIASIQISYFEAARTLGADDRFILRHVAIPATAPSIFTGVSAATGLSFCTLIVSEMVGAEAGLGWYINWAKGWSAYSKVYAAIAVMALVFSAVLALLNFVRGKVLAWQSGLTNE